MEVKLKTNGARQMFRSVADNMTERITTPNVYRLSCGLPYRMRRNELISVTIWFVQLFLSLVLILS